MSKEKVDLGNLMINYSTLRLKGMEGFAIAGFANTPTRRKKCFLA